MADMSLGERPTAANIISGRGVLRGFLVSHDQATVQTLTFYDNTAASGTVLLAIHVAPEQCPFYVMWPRRDAIPFETGLSYSGANFELVVWAVAF